MEEELINDLKLTQGETEFTKRDYILIKNIKKHGSINRAAKKLNRSYSSSQKRLKKLQKEFGKLIESKKGGKEGGGSKLTKRAKNLLKRYEELLTEHKRINQIKITTIPGKLIEQKNNICRVNTSLGEIKSITNQDYDKNQKVNVLIREDAVIIKKTEKTKPSKTSARNQFIGTINKIDQKEDLVKLNIEINNQEITTTITKESLEKMKLKKDQEVVISFKAAATETKKPL